MSWYKFFTGGSRAEAAEARLNTFLNNEIHRLSKENDSLRNENRILLDRILRVVTGDGLEVPPSPTPLTSEQVEKLRKGIDEVSNDTPYGGHPTFAQLLSTAEHITFQEDAQRETGYEEIQEGAEVQNAMAEETEEQRTARLGRQRQAFKAAAAVQREYELRIPPVLK